MYFVDIDLNCTTIYDERELHSIIMSHLHLCFVKEKNEIVGKNKFAVAYPLLDESLHSLGRKVRIISNDNVGFDRLNFNALVDECEISDTFYINISSKPRRVPTKNIRWVKYKKTSGLNKDALVHHFIVVNGWNTDELKKRFHTEIDTYKNKVESYKERYPFVFLSSASNERDYKFVVKKTKAKFNPTYKFEKNIETKEITVINNSEEFTDNFTSFGMGEYSYKKTEDGIIVVCNQFSVPEW